MSKLTAIREKQNKQLNCNIFTAVLPVVTTHVKKNQVRHCEWEQKQISWKQVTFLWEASPGCI
jgi:hypothetical protein